MTFRRRNIPGWAMFELEDLCVIATVGPFYDLDGMEQKLGFHTSAEVSEVRRASFGGEITAAFQAFYFEPPTNVIVQNNGSKQTTLLLYGIDSSRMLGMLETVLSVGFKPEVDLIEHIELEAPIVEPILRAYASAKELASAVGKCVSDCFGALTYGQFLRRCGEPPTKALQAGFEKYRIAL